MQPPPVNIDFTDATHKGRFSQPWAKWFIDLVKASPSIVAVAMPGSPFTFFYPSRGALYVTAGSVSGVSVKRGLGPSISLPATGPYVFAQGDVLTYSFVGGTTVFFASI